MKAISFDPFLLLDELGPVALGPGEAKGAPDHPHRGFETVTYILEGRLQQKDSQGRAGLLGPGNVQWMTAGAGLVHSEMPEAEFAHTGGLMHGFQLWVNLPKRDKMMRPRYQEILSAQIPTATSADGVVTVKYQFLKMLDLVMASVRNRDDFHRITYETLQQAAEHGVRHREMFWNPTTHMACGVPYETAVDGIIAGIRDARTDFGIQCFLIAAINRMGTPELGLEMVQTVLDDPREELVGIGMDYAEAEYPPEKFWKAYRLAGERGLRRTGHASEEAPARDVET